MKNDPLGAFINYEGAVVEHANDGPLLNKTFGVKDLFDVAGYPTGCGHPLKRAQSAIATKSASCVQAVLDAAIFAGKTHTDEIAYSLNGENFHYGTPDQPCWHPIGFRADRPADRLQPWLAGLVDFAIGSDTGGSVRIPASYCGRVGNTPDLRRSAHRRRHAVCSQFRHGRLVRPRPLDRCGMSAAACCRQRIERA